jgi:indole-3-glycerol phosphate synthase
LDDATLRRLSMLAGELGMATLMEAHTEDEAKRLVQAGGSVIGVNNRNLSTFAVDLGTFGRVRRFIPDSCVAVAESGISNAEDARRLRQDGCDAILVGEILIRSSDPAKALMELKNA